MAEQYKVLKIDELTKIGELMQPEQYYRHTIKTKGGIIMMVNIDAKDFIEVKVKAILEKRAIEADKILAL